MDNQLHDKLIDHYKSKKSTKESTHMKIESIVKQTYQKKIN